MAVLAPDGVSVVVTVAEPTKNTDGSSLTDLAKVKIFWKLANGKDTPSVEVVQNATSPTGGGTVQFAFKAPVLPCEAADVTGAAWVSNAQAKDSAGVAFNLRLDRMSECPPKTPAAPTGVTIA